MTWHSTRSNTYWRPPAHASIEQGEAENDDGNPVDTVTAICRASGCRGEETFGTSPASVRRALLTLTKRCTCGARFHAEGR